MNREIFTIGHSTHSIEFFVDMLIKNSIQVVADVRSSPFSRFNPQFNREDLQTSLSQAGIRYVFLGKELGARSDDSSCYVGNKVQYDRLSKTALFQSGLNRVIEGASKFRVALMCAEKDPLDCHRTILVARELVKRGYLVTHILDNGTCEPHGESIKRLVKALGMTLDDMFRSEQEVYDDAYARQAGRIAYEQSERRTPLKTSGIDIAL